MSVLSAATLRSEADLLALVPAWRALWRRCPAATPFQHPAWLVPWWTVFHPGDLCVVAVVEAGADLVGLAPLYQEEGALGHRLLPLGISVSDYLDALVDPARPDGDVSLASEVARSAGTGRVDWEELPPGADALTLPTPPGWRDGVAAQSACPVLALRGTLDESVPALKLRKLRMARRRAERRGWHIEQATQTTAPVLLDALVRLHGARWETRGETGVLAHDDIRAFHAAVVPGLLADGVLRLTGVHLGGTLAGVYYGFSHAGRAYAYLGGFDPAFAYESPGTLLMGHAIEQAIAEGAIEFHFLRGREAYKYDWGAADRWNSRRTWGPSR